MGSIVLRHWRLAWVIPGHLSCTSTTILHTNPFPLHYTHLPFVFCVVRKVKWLVAAPSSPNHPLTTTSVSLDISLAVSCGKGKLTMPLRESALNGNILVFRDLLTGFYAAPTSHNNAVWHYLLSTSHYTYT